MSSQSPLAPFPACRALTSLDDDVLALVLEILASDATLAPHPSYRDIISVFDRAVGNQTAVVSVPRVSRRFGPLVRSFRLRHVQLCSSGDLERFAAVLGGSPLLVECKTLDITIDDAGSLVTLPVILAGMVNLQRLSFRYVPPTRTIHGRRTRLPPKGSIPEEVVRAVSMLSTIEVLILGDGYAHPTRAALQTICAGMRGLRVLHIPRSLQPRNVDGGPDLTPPFTYDSLQVLSIGTGGRLDTLWSFPEVMFNGSFPGLHRLNVLGLTFGDLEPLRSNLVQVRTLETISLNTGMWAALAAFRAGDSSLPRVEDLILHMDDHPRPLGDGLPYLRTVTVLDDLEGGGGEDWERRMVKILEYLARLKGGSPRFSSVAVWGHVERAGLDTEIEHALQNLSSQGINCTWARCRVREVAFV